MRSNARKRGEQTENEPFLTPFSEQRSAIFSAAARLQTAESGLTEELLKRLPDGDWSFVCERCGAMVWLEVAEGERLILVEADGAPHEDRCLPAAELFDLEEGAEDASENQ